MYSSIFWIVCPLDYQCNPEPECTRDAEQPGEAGTQEEEVGDGAAQTDYMYVFDEMVGGTSEDGIRARQGPSAHGVGETGRGGRGSKVGESR